MRRRPLLAAGGMRRACGSVRCWLRAFVRMRLRCIGVWRAFMRVGAEPGGLRAVCAGGSSACGANPLRGAGCGAWADAPCPRREPTCTWMRWRCGCARGERWRRGRAWSVRRAGARAGRARLPYAWGACARAAGVRADASGAGSLRLSLVGRCARGGRRRPAAAADGWPRRPHLHAFGGTRCTGQTAIRGKNFNLCAHKLKFLPPSGAETGITDAAAGAASRKTAGQRNMTCRVIFRGCRIS